jgi:hypothetical protein
MISFQDALDGGTLNMTRAVANRFTFNNYGNRSLKLELEGPNRLASLYEHSSIVLQRRVSRALFAVWESAVAGWLCPPFEL